MGALLGAYTASSCFELSESLRDLYNLHVQVAWLLPIVLSRVLLRMMAKLPKKIQRSMREPIQPRYAISMQHGAETSSGNYHVIFDEDEEAVTGVGSITGGVGITGPSTVNI